MTHKVLKLSELAAGEMRSVTVGKVLVAIVRKPDGNVCAVRDRCSHQGAQLSNGRIEPLVIGNEPGTHELAETFVLRCPWHGFEFDLDTGRCIADPERQRVRIYPVTIEGDDVVVDL
jgi:3-phenylpropionate/trans-cinnamate dioxygenase ferredoxin subunit